LKALLRLKEVTFLVVAVVVADERPALVDSRGW